MKMRRLLSIGHSYSVALNRRLAEEIHCISHGEWDVTVVSPNEVCGDMRRIRLEPSINSGAKVIGVSTSWGNRVHFLRYGRETKSLIREENWSLVHIWEEPYIVCGEQLSRWAKQVPHVFFTFQNIPKHYPPPFRWFEEWSMSRATGWIAAGKTVEEALVKKKCYSSKTHQTIPLGVDMGVFQRSTSARENTLRRLGWDDNDSSPILGYIGRFVPEKGLDLIMSVLPEILGKWRMMFVGGGAYEGKLRAFATKFPQQIRVITGISHHEVPSVMSAMDIMLAPSQTTPAWREQLGRMLLEAFACKVAVIASDSGEIPNVVGDVGRVISESDEIQWINAIQELLDSPQQRFELTKNAYERCHTMFDWKIIAQRHIDFFDELLESNRSS